MRKMRYLLGFGIGSCCLQACGFIAILPEPHNPFWQLCSGYYRYDPRTEAPPIGLVLDRPEDSLHYYMDATLAACNGVYPPVSSQPVQRYEVELVEYLGKSNYHAFSHIHTRLLYADGISVPVTFRFEAGHNEGNLWYLEFGSTVRAGSWIAQGGLLESPNTPPPGWQETYSTALTCDHLAKTHPYKIGN